MTTNLSSKRLSTFFIVIFCPTMGPTIHLESNLYIIIFYWSYLPPLNKLTINNEGGQFNQLRISPKTVYKSKIGYPLPLYPICFIMMYIVGGTLVYTYIYITGTPGPLVRPALAGSRGNGSSSVCPAVGKGYIYIYLI